MYDIHTALELGQQQQQTQNTHAPSTAIATTTKTKTTAAAATPFDSEKEKWLYTSLHRCSTAHSTCSVITPIRGADGGDSDRDRDSSANLKLRCDPATATHMTLLSLRRRRLFQRQACLLSILAAFVFGLALGVFAPMLGLANVFETLDASPAASAAPSPSPTPSASSLELIQRAAPLPPLWPLPNRTADTAIRPPSHFPTIYEPRAEAAADAPAPAPAPGVSQGEKGFAVAFIKDSDVELSAEQVFRNAFHLEQDKNAPNAMIVKKLDATDGSIREFHVQRTASGRFRKGPERRLSKPSLAEQALRTDDAGAGGADGHAGAAVFGDASVDSVKFVPMAQRIVANAAGGNQRYGIIKADIYWGELVEHALPKGFSAEDGRTWNSYVTTQGVVERLEPGCGRMQNRLVIFADGTRACARYRQNTDQIQGELFSFYLGQLLRLNNLAPSAAAVVDLESRTWSSALADITQSQWKQPRPVVLTRWLPDLEPAGIPQPFQPLERHLNKYDVWNITLRTAAKAAAAAASPSAAAAADEELKQKGLLERLGGVADIPSHHDHHQSVTLESLESALAALNSSASSTTSASSVVLQRLIELAQWSDLIVFDYLIANLDRVVNNLYNFQWNADIMAAPAHNLARQMNTQLLVFLDNESGLLHGYRLLKKYEAYHGLLLDNLCVFREPTIKALRELRTHGAGRKLRELFEQTTSAQVRDVLPSLPDKSIKILVDRIDRVLGQVQKCRDLFAGAAR